MSPNFGLLGRGQSYRYSSVENLSRFSLDQDNKQALLSDHEKNFSKEDSGRISASQLSISKASFYSGTELPTARGCSFTQTVFNCKLQPFFFSW